MHATGNGKTGKKNPEILQKFQNES